jgi:cytochrome b
MAQERHEEESDTVKVWDVFVRVFHWTLVLSFAVAYFTEDGALNWHVYAGYLIAGLIIFRLIWGVIGSQYARFSQFIYPPSTVVSYLKEIKAGSPTHYLGHNPAGGYMILSLLFMLTVTTYTGLKVYGIEGHGPLASDIQLSIISNAVADDDDDDDDKSKEAHEKGESEEEEFWEEIHEVAANITLLLIFLHVLGVIVSSRLHKENLARAMVTGNKQKNV